LRKQKTIAKEFSISGVALHTGKNVTMELSPLPENSGIVFEQNGNQTTLSADSVIGTEMATTIGGNGVKIHTVEHFLSAVRCLGISNILIQIDGNEPPVLDGSGVEFLKIFEENGVIEQNENRKIFVIEKEVFVQEENRFVSISPNKNGKFEIDSKIDFENRVIGVQEFSLKSVNLESYKNELASARTFGFLKDFEYLKSKGLALGASYENVIVVGDDEVLNEGGLRFENEFVRHKILDVIGDFAVLNSDLIGTYKSFAGSHRLNNQLIKKILSDKSNYSVRS
jgi:UDP-3-O-[3-hydroxymyristoyl] N-acetylglucosamine deacetylase